jgi:uncharacterized protein YegL
MVRGSTLTQPQVDMKCTVNRTHVKSNSPATLFVAVDLKTPGTYARGPEMPDRLPLNIALAIDCSGSMQENNKLEYAQQAAISLVRALRPSDLVSIVSFETEAHVEIPMGPATNKPQLENAITAIPLGKETDLHEGLRLAWQQVVRASRAAAISRIILLTDGEPTRGKTKQKDFLALAGEIRQTGIPVTTIGVGPKYNEDLLMKIAQATASLWYHVSNPAYMGDIFAEEVTQMAKTIVKSPILMIAAHEGTEILDAYTMRPMVAKLMLPSTSPRYDFRLKDIVAGEDQTLFLRAKVPGRPPGQYPLAQFQLGTLTSELTITSTDDDLLAGVETDPYPRLLWVAGDGLTQIQHWIDGETVARVEVDTRLRTLLADQNLPTVLRANPNLETAVTQLRDAHDQVTRLAPSGMNEDDKKRLRRDTTVLKKVGR